MRKNIPSMKELRVRLASAVDACRRREWPDTYVDKIAPYPFFRVKPEDMSVEVGNFLRIKVRASGHIDLTALSPDAQAFVKQMKNEAIDQIPYRWFGRVNDEFQSKVLVAAFPYIRTAEWRECPKGWGGVRRVARQILRYYPDKIFLHAEGEKLSKWLLRKAAPPIQGIAGIHNTRALGHRIRKEVSLMIERDPNNFWLTRRFFWRPTFTHPAVGVWNRLIKLKPVLLQLNKDNPRFITPYFLYEAERWLLGSKDHQPNLNTPMSALADFREKTLSGKRSQALWRFLCQVPPNRLTSLYAQQDRAEKRLGVFDVIDMLLRRQVGILPSDTPFIAKLEANYELRFIEHPAILPLFEAAAREYVKVRESSPKRIWRSVSKRQERVGPIFEQLALIADYLNLCRRPGHWDKPDEEALAAVGLEWPAQGIEAEGWNLVPPKGVGLQWFASRSKAWHEKMVLVEAERQEVMAACQHYYEQQNIVAQSRLRWESLIDGRQINGLEIVPLTSALQLQEEGSTMHHCVGSYSSECLNDRSRIFSVRQDGKGVATVELVERGRDRWSVRQCFGPCNSSIDDMGIKRAVEELASAYSAAALARRRELQKAA